MTVSKTFRLDAEVVEKLEKIAQEEKRTLANLVKKILSDFAESK
jgi:predicted transcriptional regulator